MGPVGCSWFTPSTSRLPWALGWALWDFLCWVASIHPSLLILPACWGDLQPGLSPFPCLLSFHHPLHPWDASEVP